MDHGGDNITSEHWDWPGKECCFEDFDRGVSQCSWNEDPLRQDDLSYVLDETTPTKACGDLNFHINQYDIMSKEIDELLGSHRQLKRRRMLRFDEQEVENSLQDDDGTLEASEWVPGVSDVSASSGEMEQTYEGWLVDCFGNTDVYFNGDDLNLAGASSDLQVSLLDQCGEHADKEAVVAHKHVAARSRHIVVKGRKTFLQIPKLSSSSVAYPFDLIKPCGIHGDVTLKDINQRILTPSKLKSKYDEHSPYPTSAFSGKPVVGTTKIRTEGGKGSITIMRTIG